MAAEVVVVVVVVAAEVVVVVVAAVVVVVVVVLLLSDMPDKADVPTPAEAFIGAPVDEPKPIAAGLSPEEKEKTAEAPDAAAAGKPKEAEKREAKEMAKKEAPLGKGQMGSALMGPLQISCFLTEGLFGYSR